MSTPSPQADPRGFLRALFDAAVKRALPEHNTAAFLPPPPRGRTVVLVISRDDVNLWTFAALFRDELKCPDALYLDGVISALWAKDAGREADLGKGPFAGIITAAPR